MYSKIVTLDRGAYTWCTVNLHGANITSWRVRNIEQLFVSTGAMYALEVIRGGVQIIFPQYGSWKDGPHHGFGRDVMWQVEQAPKRLESGDVEAIFTLEDDAYTWSMWPFRFRLRYCIKLMEKDIKLSMTISNTDKNYVIFSQLVFHPYFRVPDIKEVKVAGLMESEVLDKLISTTGSEEIPVLKIDSHIDRIYKNTKKHIIIKNVANNKMIRMEKVNCPDVVIWNPWDKRHLRDLMPKDYLKMIVVACGHCFKHIRIAPGESVNCEVTLRLLKE